MNLYKGILNDKACLEFKLIAIILAMMIMLCIRQYVYMTNLIRLLLPYNRLKIMLLIVSF